MLVLHGGGQGQSDPFDSLKRISCGRNNTTALVLGCNEVASAIARALHVAGWAVALTDEIDPPCPWRGMSYVDAWYFGTAELEGVGACFCSSVRSIPAVIDRQGLIAATTWSWRSVAAALQPELLVDAQTANGGVPRNVLREATPAFATIGCGPGFTAPKDVDIAIDTSYGKTLGSATTTGAIPADLGRQERRPGTGMERFSWAPQTGRFRTQLRCGDAVVAGDILADVNDVLISARISGVLRGLSARGARVNEGQIVAEVDVRSDPALCEGVDPRGARVALAVLEATDSLGATKGWGPRNANAERHAAIQSLV